MEDAVLVVAWRAARRPIPMKTFVDRLRAARASDDDHAAAMKRLGLKARKGMIGHPLPRFESAEARLAFIERYGDYYLED